MEELKQQTARLQEKLSSLLFSDEPSAKVAPPAPALDAKAVSGSVAKVIEISKSEPAPAIKPLPLPIKSSLDTEEVKIPSWLEPLARNAAASSQTHEAGEREKAKHAPVTSSREDKHIEPLPLAESESAPEIEQPGVGSLLPLNEKVLTHAADSHGSRSGAWMGLIAAVVLLGAGGAWYWFSGSNGPHSPANSSGLTSSTQTRAAIPEQANARPPEPSEARDSAAAPDHAPSAPATKTEQTPPSVPVIRDKTNDSASTIPAAVTERVSRPTPAPEPKKPSLGQVYLASPMMNRPETPQDSRVDAPAISSGDSSSPAAGLNSPLATGNEKQPPAPEVPLPVGGDVKAATLLREVAPVYPALASNQHVTGNVVIDALIDADGRVTTMKVLSGPILLQQAAKEALRQWKYQPATLDGKPVAMHLTVTLRFGIQ